MTDNSFAERRRNVGFRIYYERTSRKLTQAKLAELVAEITGDEQISQSTISDWERGITMPPVTRLFALSKIFQCNCGFLLCDYPDDYDEKTYNAHLISLNTGLSHESVEYLCASKSWGDGKNAASVLDLLIWDERQAREGRHPQSILSYLWFFFHFNDSVRGRALTCNGQFVDSTGAKYYDPNYVNLNSDVLENAVLLKMIDNLKQLKKTYKEMKQEGGE